MAAPSTHGVLSDILMYMLATTLCPAATGMAVSKARDVLVGGSIH